MLEQIAKQVNLKKRVVQVWYQNSRARERKGQYRSTTTTGSNSGNLMSTAGNLMLMDSYGGPGGSASGGCVDDAVKSPKLLGDVASGSSASDLGFLFNTFKQHY